MVEISDISILGAGSWGTSMAHLLAENGRKVNLWSYSTETYEFLLKNRYHKFLPHTVLSKGISFFRNIRECIENVPIVIIAVPSHGVRELSKNLSKLLVPEQVVVSISKGMENDTLMFISQIIRSEGVENPLAVMCGPSHAEEVIKFMPTVNVVASTDQKLAENIQKQLSCPSFRIYTCSDVIGVEVGSSVKNVIAICSGICEGLGFGDNAKAAIITRGIVEITRLGKALGARVETFAGVSGIGDLIVTCISRHGRNKKFGTLIGQNYSVEDAKREVKMVIEGLTTAEAVYNLSKRHNVSMPIVDEAYSVLFDGKKPMDAVRNLMSRSFTHEFNI